MDINTLILRIERLLEDVKNQSKISPLDIDLQLDYIRKLYDAYLELKCNFANNPCQLLEKTDDETIISELSDCRTMSLFGGGTEGKKNEESEKIAEEERTVIEEMEAFDDEAEIEEEQEIWEEEDEADEEEEEIWEDDDEEENIAEEIEDEEDEEDEEEDDLPIVEMEEEMESSIPESAEKQEELSDINLDDIEFDEDDDVESVPPTHFSAPIPHSRYYGDEIEIENPIPVQSSTIGEQFKNQRPSLNEIVSSYKSDESIGSKLQQGTVSDLMKSMDMNHKFMFVKELFKGNGSAFTEEVNKLNSFHKLSEAIPYWELIKEKYKWDDQSEAYTELYRLILRKFAKQ